MTTTTTTLTSKALEALATWMDLTVDTFSDWITVDDSERVPAQLSELVWITQEGIIIEVDAS